jgi:DNA repair protein RecO (recombination protein O)
MPTYRDKGFVLKARGLRDADRHYAIFTQYHGKIVVLAKGSRKGSSKLAPHLGTFGMVDVMVARGRVIDRLAGASIVVSHGRIMESLEKTALLQSFLIAVDALTKRELPDERIFALIDEVQRTLVADTAMLPGTGRSLLFDAACARLLDLLGFGVELGECVTCRNALVPEGNAMNIIRGGIECAGCRDGMAMLVSPETIKAMRYLRTGPLEAVPLLRMPQKTRHDVGFVTDLLLTHHLESRFSALQYLRQVA